MIKRNLLTSAKLTDDAYITKPKKYVNVKQITDSDAKKQELD
jgi:hypothetical protein